MPPRTYVRGRGSILLPRPLHVRANEGCGMNQTQTIQYAESDDRIYLRIYLLLSKGGGWPSFGVLIGLVGGLLSVPLASLLWTMSTFIGPVEIGPTLNLLSNILFALTLPLLALGACCLDLLENKFPTTGSALALPINLNRWRHLRPSQPHKN
jgi:hypothetical protein